MNDSPTQQLPPVAILGAGRFGRFLAAQLSGRTQVSLWDRSDLRGTIPERTQQVTLKEACQAPVVVLAVPIRALPDVLRAIAGELGPGTLVIDTASVKVWPIRWMQELLPIHVQILGTHPLFGPDSASHGFRGQKIVTVPVRVRHPLLVRSAFESLGLHCIVTTGEQHDREMAQTQALTHWIGRGLQRIEARPREIDTRGYRKLLDILHYVRNDSWELFEDLERWNPYAQPMRERFLEELGELDRELGGSQ